MEALSVFFVRLFGLFPGLMHLSWGTLRKRGRRHIQVIQVGKWRSLRWWKIGRAPPSHDGEEVMGVVGHNTPEDAAIDWRRGLEGGNGYENLMAFRRQKGDVVGTVLHVEMRQEAQQVWQREPRVQVSPRDRGGSNPASMQVRLCYPDAWG